jgi:HK97 family phage prohead protease
MPAIRPHSTDVSEGEWDAAMHERRLLLDADPEYYEAAYAWRDPEANPRTKSGYRFIHHEVREDGTIGPANVRACRAGIAVLNGARGGTTIPDEDKLGVWRHLARHLEDAGLEPPPLRRAGRQAPERRAVRAERVELRQDGDGPRRLVGVAAIYGEPTEIAPGIVESIRAGAFAKSLAESDIVALYQHDMAQPLGRTSTGTLRLSDTEQGLYFDLALPRTSYADDLIELAQRGDIGGASIGFIPMRIELDVHGSGYEIVEAQLIEISPVTMPAYPQTWISLRHMLEWRQHVPAWAADEIASMPLNMLLSQGDVARLLQAIRSAPEARGAHHPLHRLRLELMRRELATRTGMEV